MTAKHNDCKEQWLQRRMTAKNNDRKERWLQENNDCKKAMTGKNSHCKEQLWKEVSHKCFVFTTSTCSVWRKSGTRASYIQNLSLQCLKEVSHESFVCATLICRFVRKSRTKASFSHLQLAARCAAPETQALPANRGRNPCVFILPNSKLYFLFYDLFYDLFPLPNSEYVCFYSQSGFAQSIFHNFNLQCLKDSHESFVFTTSTCSVWRVWRKSGTRTSYSKLQLAVLEGSLTRELRLHNFNLQVCKDISHESFVYTSSTCS